LGVTRVMRGGGGARKKKKRLGKRGKRNLCRGGVGNVKRYQLKIGKYTGGGLGKKISQLRMNMAYT